MKHALTVIALTLAACTTTQPPQLVQPTASAAVVDGYWECEKAANSGMLGLAEASQCSVIYEALLASFPGQNKFQQFYAWWQVNKSKGAAPR